MKLWLLEQTKNNDYDTYDSCVVVAEKEGDAKSIHPDGKSRYRKGYYDYNYTWRYEWFFVRKDGSDYCAVHRTWAGTPLDVTATYIGEADSSLKEGTVICASFNAG